MWPHPKTVVLAVWRAVVALFRRKPIWVSDEERHIRVEICHICPHYLEESAQCGRCKCFVEYKAALATETCPDDNWPHGAT